MLSENVCNLNLIFICCCLPDHMFIVYPFIMLCMRVQCDTLSFLIVTDEDPRGRNVLFELSFLAT